MSHQKSINKRLAASKLAGAEGATPETNSNKKVLWVKKQEIKIIMVQTLFSNHNANGCYSLV